MVEQRADSAALEQRLGYRFTDPQLLRIALTHSSHGAQNNERLEFLGDALIGLVVSEELYRRFPEQREGALSRLRSALVRREALAQMARDLEVPPLLRLGSGESRSGGAGRDSILAGAMEAIAAAVCLDAGTARAIDIVRSLFAARLDIVDAGRPHKDPKTELQEFLQARHCALPSYELVEVSGEQHRQRFRVRCSAEGLEQPVCASGASKRAAEQGAARRALRKLRGEADS